MIWPWIVGALGFLLLSGVVMTMIIAWIIYATLLRRNKPGKWDRGISFPEDEEYCRMHDIGIAWGEKYKDRIREEVNALCAKYLWPPCHADFADIL